MRAAALVAIREALGYSPAAARAGVDGAEPLPLTDAEENARLADALRKAASRFAENKRFLVCTAGLLAILEEIGALPEELESEICEVEEEANGLESAIENGFDTDKTKTVE
jgi:hypothetical protein